ncbi:hypothetical protein ACWEOG_03600 [Amycolatopsis japonica]
MKRRLGTCAVLTTLAVLGVSGCGPKEQTDQSLPPATASSASGLDGWADRVCQAVRAETAPIRTLPSISSPDTQQIKQALGKYADNLHHVFGKVSGRLGEIGAPPVANGPQILNDATTSLRATQQEISAIKTRIDQAPTDQHAVFQETMGKASSDLGNLNEPMKNLGTDGQLKAAFTQAPSCS